MNPLLEDRLLDLLVNIVSIIIGGGLITAIIEWRRHKREMMTWQKEDATIQIDIPVARMSASLWAIGEKTADKEKLMIYENGLEKTVKQFVIYAEFVIRNTTAAEIIVRDYFAEVPNIPFWVDEVDYYDLETFDLISKRDVGAIRLMPYATIPRAVVYVANFDKGRKLERDALPTTLTISVMTSSGKTIQGSATINVIGALAGLVGYDGKVYPVRYYAKVFAPPPEDEIPF
jgi:hypothetical protein